MSLDATNKEVNFVRSMKKFITDELETLKLRSVFFELLYSTPKAFDTGIELNAWVVVSFSKRAVGTVTSQFVVFDLYTNNDPEKISMYEFSDDVMDVFTDLDHPLGLKVVDFYDTADSENWENIGGILPYHRIQTEIYPAKDKTWVRTITFEAMWAAV